MKNLTFTQLLPHIRETYPERSRAFHLVATRYYLGAETDETLAILTQERPTVSQGRRSPYGDAVLPPLISMGDAVTMVQNR